MTTPTHDPEIEQEAERMLWQLENETDQISIRCIVYRNSLIPLLRELATLRRKAAAPLSDDRLREIEERAAKATKGPWPEHALQELLYLNSFRSSDEIGANRAFISHAREDIDTLLAALRSRGGEGERWIPCSERMPEVEEYVLAVAEHEEGPPRVIAAAYLGNVWSSRPGGWNYKVTHWRPMAELPKAVPNG